MKYTMVGISLAILMSVGCASKVSSQGSDESYKLTQNQPQIVEEENRSDNQGDNFVDLSKVEEPKQIETSLQPVYFGFDKYDISEEMKQVIQMNSSYIQSHVKDGSMKKVLLEGNTDEFGSSEYNFALGLKRAIAVRDALILQGVDTNIIEYVSYGKTNPVCSEKTSECYANNRRVDVSNSDKEVKSGATITKDRS